MKPSTRSEIGNLLASVPVSDHEQVKDLLRPALKQWCKNTCDGVRDNERTAMNNWARAMQIIGATPEVNINLATTQTWGLSYDEVAGIIESHRRSGAMTIEQCAADGVQLLLWCMQQEPERRAAILDALGGVNALALGENNGRA